MGIGRPRKDYSKAKILEAIKASHGIVTSIARRLGCSRTVAERNIARFPETKRALRDEREAVVDFVESKAFERVQAGDTQMIMFMLRNLGRMRGYNGQQAPDASVEEVQIVDDIGGVV